MENKAEIIISGRNQASAVINGVTKDLDNLENKSSGLSKSIGTAFNSVSSSLISLGTTAAIGAVAGLGMVLKSTIDTADGLDEMSQRTGVSVESLSTLSYAAKLGAIDIDVLESSLTKFTRVAFESQDPSSEQAKLFRQIGISAEDATGKLRPADELLLDIADKFENMPDGMTKAALAMKLFGKSGTDLIPFLNQGKQGISDLQKEAQSLGLEISTNTALQAAQFNDQMDKMKGRVQGVAVEVATQMLPALNELVTTLQPLLITASKVASEKLQSIGTSAKFIFNTYESFVNSPTFEKLKWLSQFSPGNVLSKVGEGSQIDLKKTGLMQMSDYLKEVKPDISFIQQGLFRVGNNELVKIGDNTKIFKAEVESTTKESKKLIDEWKTFSVQLDRDMIKWALPEMSVKIQEIIWQHDDWKEKYKDIKESNLQLIEHQKSQIINLLKLRDLTGYETYTPPVKIPTQLETVDTSGILPIDKLKENLDVSVPFLEAFFNTHNEKSSEMRQQTVNAFGGMSQAAMSFYELSGRKSKELFTLQKAFAIAQATINTYEGATKALAQGGILGYVMAAGIIAAGLANVATIASTQPGASSSGRGGSLPSVPSYSNSNNSSSGTSTGNREVNIIVYGNILDQDKFAREFLPYLRQAEGDGA